MGSAGLNAKLDGMAASLNAGSETMIDLLAGILAKP